jgi:hypothetical protein
MKTSLNRRQFLKLMGISSLSLLLQRCRIRPTQPAMSSWTRTVWTPSLTITPSPTASPQPTATPGYKATAAIGQIGTYEVSQLRGKLEEIFQQLGGLADVVRPGARITIKPSLTGTTWSDASLPAPATELFVTHPALAQALCELLIDAGAGPIRIVDGLDMRPYFRPGAIQKLQPESIRSHWTFVSLCLIATLSHFR